VKLFDEYQSLGFDVYNGTWTESQLELFEEGVAYGDDSTSESELDDDEVGVDDSEEGELLVADKIFE
jgi:hypothetical protein